MNATDIRNEAAETAKRFTALSNQSAQLIAGMSHELRETLARECGEYVHWATYPLFDMSRALEAIADGRQTPKPWIVEAVCWDRGYVRERLREYGKADTEENVDAVVEQLKPWTEPGSSPPSRNRPARRHAKPSTSPSRKPDCPTGTKNRTRKNRKEPS